MSYALTLQWPIGPTVPFARTTLLTHAGENVGVVHAHHKPGRPSQYDFAPNAYGLTQGYRAAHAATQYDLLTRIAEGRQA